MKKRYFLPSLICLLAVSCTVQELDIQAPSPIKKVAEDDVFFASLESYSTPDTKVFIDENVKMHWDAEDKLSIFNLNTQNQPYQFSGETGDVSGYFTRVSEPVKTEDNLNYICAVYPYRESTTISDSGVLTLTLPAVQTYKAGSFGLEANTMVSTTDGHFLKFKNVGGYLALKFYGSGVSVSSIRLDGNLGEPLSGEATLTPSIGANPIISMASTAGTSITLTCETPVQLGADSNHPTIFWMVVPPTAFTQGFRLTVTTPDGDVFFKETTKSLTIARNDVLRISPIEVTLSSEEYGLNDMSPVSENINYKTVVDETSRTVTVTMPTVTNFSDMQFNYDIDGDAVMMDGKVVNNETLVSQNAILTVRSGNHGKNYTLIARNTGLPIVRITTNGFTREDIENDETHENWRGTNKDRPNETAHILIEKPNGKVDVDIDTEIKGRGNATWTYDKRPYALKLNKKKTVLGMPEHKRWILLANWKDRTLLRNDAAFWLSKKSGLPYTVKGYFVELEFNGEHRGNYYLCEQIKIDKNRVNINEFKATDITGGYLMEVDNNYDEQYKFLSGFYGSSSNPKGLKFMFKEPDEDLPDEAFNYMKSYIQDMEGLIKRIRRYQDYGYREYLDMDSAIWFMLVNELTGNGDFFNTDSNDTSSQWYGPHSTYFYKDRDVQNDDGTTTRSKLFMGPVWDFDYKTFITTLTTTSWNGHTSSENRIKWVGAENSNYYYYYLCKDPVFRARMLTLWNEYKDVITPMAFSNYIDDMADYIRLSEEFNTRMWGYTNTSQDQGQNGDNLFSFQEAVNLLKQAFSNKRTFIDDNIESLNQ